MDCDTSARQAQSAPTIIERLRDARDRFFREGRHDDATLCSDADRARGLTFIACAAAAWLAVWAVIAWDERQQDEWAQFAAEHKCQRVRQAHRFLDYASEAERTYHCDTGTVIGPR